LGILVFTLLLTVHFRINGFYFCLIKIMIMKQKLLLFAVILIPGIQSHAQTGIVINTTEADPAYSALLDVTSATQELLPPRMTYELIWPILPSHVFASLLKLHEAGVLEGEGSLSSRGGAGYYWSSSQIITTTGNSLYIWTNGESDQVIIKEYGKYAGFSVRCIK